MFDPVGAGGLALACGLKNPTLFQRLGGLSPFVISAKDLEQAHAGALLVPGRGGLGDVKRSLLGQDYQMPAHQGDEAVGRLARLPLRLSGRGVHAGQDPAGHTVDVAFVVDGDHERRRRPPVSRSEPPYHDDPCRFVV